MRAVMPSPMSSSARKPASARFPMRATLIHDTGFCRSIVPPQFGQVWREADRPAKSIDVEQCRQTIAVSSRESFMTDPLGFVVIPERPDVIDYAVCTAQWPAWRPHGVTTRFALDANTGAISHRSVYFLPAYSSTSDQRTRPTLP